VTFRLLTYNIWRGGVGRVEPIARVIDGCRPDVVLLQEATRPDVVAELAERSGMPVWQSFGRQSLAYLSRRAVDHAEWHRPRFSRHAFIDVVPAGVPIRLFGLHLSAVHAAWTERRRVLELRSLLRAIAAHQHGFHVLTGDFNTLAPGAVLELNRLPPRLRPFVWLSGGRIKWRTIQTVIDAGYCDGFRVLHPEDPGMTMPAWDPHVRLDYVFVPRMFRQRLVACEVVRDGDVTTASDHLPVVADFVIDDSGSAS
jgi:endonuclease/exonuclease/phosphatase family metal-dependent hydrolase